MLKFFGRSDIVRDSESFDGTTKYNHLEFYNNNDTKTGHDIERPIENIYQNQYELMNFVEEYINFNSGGDGVFASSLTNEFQLTNDDIVSVTIDVTPTNFLRIPPGIAAISYIDTENDGHSHPLIVVNKPTTKIAERQIAKILGMNLPSGNDFIEIKYINASDTFKAKIIRKVGQTNIPTTYYFGTVDEDSFIDNASDGDFLTGVELINDIYNHADFIDFFIAAIGDNLQYITLEPIFKVTASGFIHYIYLHKTDGQFGMDTVDISGDSDKFQLSSVNIVDGGSGSLDFNTIDNTHTLFGGSQTIVITDTGADAYKIDSAGGINLTAALGVTVHDDLIVEGDLTVSGTTTTLNTTELNIEDNIITLNSGHTGAPTLNAGIIVERGDETDYNIIWDEADPITDSLFKIGEVGSEQAVATREDVPLDAVGVVWDSATSKFVSDSTFGPITPVSEFAYNTQTDFDWSVRDTGEAAITTLDQAVNTNRQDLYEYIELMSTEGASYLVAAGASLVGCDGINGVTPTAKTEDEAGNLQQMLEGLYALIDANLATATTKTSATSFPTDPVPKLGDECYRTDLDEWYKYNSVTWTQI